MSNWDGTERRASVARDNFCNQHISLATDLASIKTSAINIEKRLEEATSFKTGVILSLMGVVVAIIIQISVFSYFYGQLSNQVTVNTARLNVLEQRK